MEFFPLVIELELTNYLRNRQTENKIIKSYSEQENRKSEIFMNPILFHFEY